VHYPFSLKFSRGESFYKPTAHVNPQSRSIQFSFAPARKLNVRFEKKTVLFHVPYFAKSLLCIVEGVFCSRGTIGVKLLLTQETRYHKYARVGTYHIQTPE
jgi:hypothetical protein